MPQANWLDHIEALKDLTPEERHLLSSQAQVLSVPEKTKVFEAGAECAAFLFVIDGSVRVQMIGETGREIVLYRVENGQTCILTTACLLSNDAYNAEAISETETKAVAISAPLFHELIASSKTFRDMVFASYGERISNLVALVEEVAFGRLDIRLAQFLNERQDKEGIIKKTHYELAVEMGSAREVISRQLKEFEKKKWLELTRGQVKITNPNALKEFISSQCD